MKIIKMNKNYELGTILAKIKSEEENSITIEIDNSLNKNEIENDIDLIKDYALQMEKNLKISENTQFKKIGFVTNEDVNLLEEFPAIQKPKTNRNFKLNFNILKKIKFPKTQLPIFPIIAGFLILGAFIFYIFSIYFLPKAIIQIKLESKAFSVTEELQANINKLELENSILANKTTLSVKDTATAIPTGEKETGNKASGKIKLFNKTDSEITVKKGQIITIKTKSETLNYLTLEEISIEQKTTKDITDSEGVTTKADVFGSGEVEIEAEIFGEKYNLDKKDIKSEEIIIKGKDEDDMTAEITKNMSGGNVKKVTIALQKDLDSLLDETTKKLEQRGIDEIRSKSSDTAYFAEGAYEANIVKKIFNVKANEEASQIDLELEIEINALSFNKNDLVERLKPELKKQVPENFNLSEDQNSIEVFSSTKQKIFDEKTKVLTGAILVNRIQTKLVPKIEENKIKSDLSGVSYEKAVEYLQKIEGATGTIKPVGPDVFAFSKTLPKNVDNITIEITIDGKIQ